MTQVRAALRAAEGLSNLNLLFPMISAVSELEEAIHIVRWAYEELVEDGIRVTWPRVGVMIEVPAAVYQVEALARRVDFLSIGTNDLAQYLLAVDRSNERVAELYHSLHPAVLAAILTVVKAARRHHKPVSVCGEMAGEATAAILLLGMGIDNLSLTAGALPRIKWIIRNFSQQHARELLARALQEEKPEPIYRMLCQAFYSRGLGGLATGRKMRLTEYPCSQGIFGGSYSSRTRLWSKGWTDYCFLSVTVLPGTDLTDFWCRARIGESLKRKPDNFYFSVSRNKAQEIFR